MGQNQTKILVITNQINKGTKGKTIKCEYSWRIKNFIDVVEAGHKITSDKIIVDCKELEQSKNSCSIDEWQIHLYPQGFNQRTSDYVSVWIERISSNERLVQFTCEIISDYNVKKKFKKKAVKKLSLESVIGWSTFCKQSSILNDKGFLRDGCLNMKCTLEIFECSNILHPVQEDEDPDLQSSFLDLSNNLKELLDSYDYHDIKFKVEDEFFYAHKAIISARSPVFKAMFNSLSPCVTIDLRKETFKAMLHFIYSGECQMLPFETTFELYDAAHKYDLLKLKIICSKMLLSYLTTENAVQIIIQANKLNDERLQNTIIQFIIENADEIQSKDEWIDLMKSFPTLANDIFKSLARQDQTPIRTIRTTTSHQSAPRETNFSSKYLYWFLRLFIIWIAICYLRFKLF